jgi:hypothetical protein
MTSDFDHLLQPDELDGMSDLLSKQKDSKKETTKTLLESLSGSNDAAALANKFNLEPDMTERVLVPLLNFLDKYGVGSSVVDSGAGQTATNLLEFVNDVTPVIKNGLDYFNGKKKGLDEDDMAFLEQISAAQDAGDMSLFVGETVDEEPESEPDVIEYEAPEGSIPLDVDPFESGVDWENILGGQPDPKQAGIYGSLTAMMPEPDEANLISGMEALAKEAGLTIDEVNKSDYSSKTDRAGTGSSLVYEDDMESIDVGLDGIKAAMSAEQKTQKRSSNAFMEDSMAVPDNLVEYNPLNVEGYEPAPLTDMTLPTITELKESAPEVEDEEPQVVADWMNPDFDPEDYQVEYPTGEEDGTAEEE